MDTTGLELGDAARSIAEPGLGPVEIAPGSAGAGRLQRFDFGAETTRQPIEIVQHEVLDDVDVESARARRMHPTNANPARRPGTRERLPPARVVPLDLSDLQNPAEGLRAQDEPASFRRIAGERLLDEQIEPRLEQVEPRLDVGRGRNGDDRGIDSRQSPQIIEGLRAVFARELLGPGCVPIDDRRELAVAITGRRSRDRPGVQPAHRPGADHGDP